MSRDDIDYLRLAIAQSINSVEQGGFPVGAIIVIDGKELVTGVSNGKALNDPTSHAEIAAIRKACKKLQTRELKNAILYSSLEPCLMCYAACLWASIPKIVYACGRDKVSPQHFEGKHHLTEINKVANHQVVLVHEDKLEIATLKIIEDWEKSVQN